MALSRRCRLSRSWGLGTMSNNFRTGVRPVIPVPTSNRIQAFRRDRGGNIAMIVAFALPVFLAALALGFELGQWYMSKWSMQNAADSAVIAAANNNSNYLTEARAVTAHYGYTNGTNNVSVAVTNTATCPGGGNNCYQVTINKPTDLYLSRMVGFTGNTTVAGKRMQDLTSSAMAKQTSTPREYCVLALASSGATNGIRVNGGSQADLPGCDVMSNTNATCNGHDLGADIGDAHGTNNGCGTQQNSSMPAVSDPYSALATNISATPCTSHPQGTYTGNPPQTSQVGLAYTSPTGASVKNLLVAGTLTLSGYAYACGDVRLMGNVSVSALSNAVLVIYNGRLDTNGFTLSSTNGSGLTIVFAGSNGSYSHAPYNRDNSGMLDYAAPTTGTWKGIAMYQIPTLTSGVNVSDAGNAPAWKITGLVYLPHASVTLKGIVNKASYGASCFALVVDNLLFSGTTAILAHGECAMAGLDLPYNIVVQRAALVN